MLLTGALTIVFGSGETSDFWVDALQLWWCGVRARYRGIKRLVIYLDNGPHSSGRRRQFLKRMVQFADWSGLVIWLIYYPPVSQQVQPDRALLVVVGEEMERGAAELLGSDPRLCVTDDMARPTSRG